MEVQRRIESLLGEALRPVHLEVHNESHRHSVAPGSETHFKVVVVSAAFEGVSLVKRHRLVYDALAAPLKEGVHALSLQTYTPAEFNPQQVPGSPPCAGGQGK